MDIPVLLFHRSDHVHVSYALRSAMAFNGRVIILTDANYSRYSKFAKLELISAYPSEEVRKLELLYLHMSTNDRQFEFSCIERWFILMEYMKKNSLADCMYIDSDVLTFCNYGDIIQSNFPDTEYCLCIPQQDHKNMTWSASGHISYWTLPALEHFCAFIIQSYENHISELHIKWKWHKANQVNGGICDMTLLYLFHRNTVLTCGNLLQVCADNSCFDNSINSGDNEFSGEYETENTRYLSNPIKRIRFLKGSPSAFNTHTQQLVQFNALHFQGGAKKLMPLYIRQKAGFISLANRLIYQLRLALS